MTEAFRTRGVVGKDGSLTIAALPFACGEEVEIVVLSSTATAEASVATYRATIRRKALEIMHESGLGGFSDNARRLVPPPTAPLGRTLDDMLFDLAVRCNMDELFRDYLAWNTSSDADRLPEGGDQSVMVSLAALIENNNLRDPEEIVDVMVESVSSSYSEAGHEDRNRYSDSFLLGFITGSSIFDDAEYNYWSRVRAPYDTES